MTTYPTWLPAQNWLYGVYAPSFSYQFLVGSTLCYLGSGGTLDEIITTLDARLAFDHTPDWHCEVVDATRGQIQLRGGNPSTLTAVDRLLAVLGFDMECGETLPSQVQFLSRVPSPLAIPLISCEGQKVDLKRDAPLKIDTFRRGHGSPFGRSEIWRFKCRVDAPAYKSLQAGFCMARVRVSPFNLSQHIAGSAVPRTATQLGYIDGQVLGLEAGAWVDPSTRQFFDFTLVVATGAGESGTEPVTDTWEYLWSRGARYALSLEVFGLAQTFPEVAPKRVDSEAVVAPADGYESACPALMFEESVAFLTEPDRETGFARGDAIDFTLAWEQLERDDLLATLFRVPTKRMRLTADVSASATTISVDSTAGWVVGERGYLGHEVITIVAIVDGTTCEILRSGLRYIYRANSPSTFGCITDTPEIWPGRFITVHRHMLSPEGRALSSTWHDAQSHVIWRGFLERPPKPGEFGMQLRALPLCRMPAKKLGYELTAEVVMPDPERYETFASFPIVASPIDRITIEGEYTGGGGGEFRVTVPLVIGEAPMTVAAWARQVQTALDTALSTEPWYATGLQVVVSGQATGNPSLIPIGSLVVQIPYTAPGFAVTTMILTVHTPGAYWLQAGSREGRLGISGQPGWQWSEGWPAITIDFRNGAWLPVRQVDGAGYADLSIPNKGVALLEVDGQKELIRWDRIESAPAPQAHIQLLHIQERGVSGTPQLPIAHGAKLKFVSGADGYPRDILLKMLQSSGTETRGEYDTLGLGAGYGIPEEWIDVRSFRRVELADQQVAAYSDGRATLEELMGGWLALQGLCVTQRRVAPRPGEEYDNNVKLTVVYTDPSLPASWSDLQIVIKPGDVEMGEVQLPDVMESPTEVRVARSGVALDLPDSISQDLPLIQATTLVTKEFSAPGMAADGARDAANNRIVQGMGQSAIDIGVVPWLGAQGGDIARVELGTKKIYDWKTGTRGPASIAGRVVSDRWQPVDGRCRIKLVLAGLAPTGYYLCPSTTVRAIYSTTVFATEPDDNRRFAPSQTGIKLRLYNPGEPGESALVEVTPDGDGDWALTTGTLPVWVAADVTRATFGPRGSNDPLLEPAHHFVSPTRNWSA